MQLFLNNLQSCLSSIHSYPDVFSVSPRPPQGRNKTWGPAKVKHSSHRHGSTGHECHNFHPNIQQFQGHDVHCSKVQERPFLLGGWSDGSNDSPQAGFGRVDHLSFAEGICAKAALEKLFLRKPPPPYIIHHHFWGVLPVSTHPLGF